MITKKITKKMEDKLLRIIYQRYTKEHGYGTRKLSAYRIFTTSGGLFEKEMPEIVELDTEQNIKRYLLVDILQELRAKSYLNFSEDNISYWLSPEGYKHASKSTLEHLITYLNNNSGWAIPLAFLSFIISVITIFTGN